MRELWLIFLPLTRGSETLIISLVKSLIAEKAFNLTPNTTTLYAPLIKNAESVCVDTASDIPLRYISSLRSMSYWLNLSIVNDCFINENGFCAQNITDPIPTCNGASSVHLPDDVVAIVGLIQDPVLNFEKIQKATNRYLSCEALLDSQLNLTNVSSIIHSLTQSILFDLLCGSIAEFSIDVFVKYIQGIDTQNNYCLSNAINSLDSYFATNRNASFLPMMPDICFGLSRTNEVSIINLKTSISIHSADSFISVGPLQAPVSPPDRVVSKNLECTELRGNYISCDGRDMWFCFSAAGCYIDWNAEKCMDCPVGKFCDSHGDVPAACDPIPDDQVYIGLAWTVSQCRSKCASETAIMNNGVCENLSDLPGFYPSACDSSLQPCLNSSAYLPFVTFPFPGSCSGNYLSNVFVTEESVLGIGTAIAFWFKYVSTTVILFGGTDRVLIVSVSEMGAVIVQFNATSFCTSVTHAVKTGWNHFVFVSDSVEIFIDGKSVALCDTHALSPQKVFIGPLLDEDSISTGVDIYDFRFFNGTTPFSIKTIQLLFASTAPLLDDWTRAESCMFGSPVNNDCTGTEHDISIEYADTNGAITTSSPATDLETSTTDSEYIGAATTEMSRSAVETTSDPTSLTQAMITTTPSNSISTTSVPSTEISSTTGVYDRYTFSHEADSETSPERSNVSSETTVADGIFYTTTSRPDGIDLSERTSLYYSMLEVNASDIASASSTTSLTNLEGMWHSNSRMNDAINATASVLPILDEISSTPPTATSYPVESSTFLSELGAGSSILYLTSSAEAEPTTSTEIYTMTDQPIYVESDATVNFQELSDTFESTLVPTTDSIIPSTATSTSISTYSQPLPWSFDGESSTTVVTSTNKEEETPLDMSESRTVIMIHDSLENTTPQSTTENLTRQFELSSSTSTYPADSETPTSTVTLSTEYFDTTSLFSTDYTDTTGPYKESQYPDTVINVSSQKKTDDYASEVIRKSTESLSTARNFIPSVVPGIQTQDFSHQQTSLDSFQTVIIVGSSVTAFIILFVTVASTAYMQYRRRMTRQVISV